MFGGGEGIPELNSTLIHTEHTTTAFALSLSDEVCEGAPMMCKIYSGAQIVHTTYCVLREFRT